MADIVATRPSTNTTVPGFDWALSAAGSTDITRHDFSDFCSGAVTAIERMDCIGLLPDQTLDTAVILSLFTDRAAGPDDVLPAGTTDQRGWLGDALDDNGDETGSHLWLGYFTKSTAERAEFMQFAATESLAWMTRDGVADSVVVTTDWLSDSKLGLYIAITRPDDLAPVYRISWALTLGAHT